MNHVTHRRLEGIPAVLIAAIICLAGCTQPEPDDRPSDNAQEQNANQRGESDAGDDVDDTASGDPGDTDPAPDADANDDAGNNDDANDDAGNNDDEPSYTAGDPPSGSDSLLLTGADLEEETPDVLQQGMTLTWEQGLQGGFHIWGGFEATGDPFLELDDDDLDDVSHAYDVYDTDGDLVATTNRIGFVEETDDGIEAGGFTVILRRSIDPEETTDDVYQFVVTVELPDNSTYESAIWTYFDCCHWL